MQYAYNDWDFGLLMKDFSTTVNFWNINQNVFPDQYESSGNIIPEDNIEITYPQFICGVGREFIIRKDFTILSELGFTTTWDGRRNTLISNDVFSVNPSIGLEIGYKKSAFFRFGFGNFQKESLINGNEKMKFQPNFGIGVDVWSFVLDYSLTDLGNNSADL